MLAGRQSGFGKAGRGANQIPAIRTLPSTTKARVPTRLHSPPYAARALPEVRHSLESADWRTGLRWSAGDCEHAKASAAPHKVPDAERRTLTISQ